MFKKICLYTLSILAIILLNLLTFFNISIGNINIHSPLSYKYGMIRGGIFKSGYLIVYDIDVPNYSSKNETIAKNIETCLSVIEARLENAGYLEAKVYRSDSTEVIVELPNVRDISAVAKSLEATGQLEFTDYENAVLMTGKYIEKAFYEDGAVKIKLSEDGVEKFADASKYVASKADIGMNFIQININGEALSRVYVDGTFSNTGIISDTIKISGGFSHGEAAKIIDSINNQYMPYELSQNTVINMSNPLTGNTLVLFIFIIFAAFILAELAAALLLKRCPLAVVLSADLFFCVLLISLGILKFRADEYFILTFVFSLLLFILCSVSVLSNKINEINGNRAVFKSKIPYTSAADISVVVILAAVSAMFFAKGSFYAFLQAIICGTLLNLVFAAAILPVFIKYFSFSKPSKGGCAR